MTFKDRRRANTGTSATSGQILRRRAEEIPRAHAPPSREEPELMSIEATRSMLHELHVHQIELEMQNEELRRAQVELDHERARYIDLYDQAPVGYFTLSDQGLIQQANLTAAALLGLPRNELVNQRISRFILQEDQDVYYLLRQQLLKSGEPQSRELRMLKKDGTPFCAQLAATVAHDADGVRMQRVVLNDITERRRSEENLRIAATAFEAQEGIIVTDANNVILRVNRAFTRMSGYSAEEVVGKTPRLMRSERQSKGFYAAMWHGIKTTGSWQGDLWNRRKNGEEFPEHLSITAVKDEGGKVTHYVGYLVDATHSQLQEQQRLLNEAAHRDMLVREVHHRIKNNLQGILGILRKFANQHPETADPMHHAISQVQTISVIHGLQGRAVTSAVLLCELIHAIANEIQALWQTPIQLAKASEWLQHVIAEDEAVPIALVINELVLNAVKHGGQAHGGVRIVLQKGSRPEVVQIKITNSGQFASDSMHNGSSHSGLHLISALMPNHGARILREQQGNQVVTLLELEPPVIFPNFEESTWQQSNSHRQASSSSSLTTTDWSCL